MESFINQRVEAAISAANERGDFDHLPGAGQPIDLNDAYSRVPKSLRMGYKILKNSGYLPHELEKRQSALKMVDLLEKLHPSDPQYHQTDDRLKRLRQRMEIAGIETSFIDQYYREISTKRAD